MSSLSAVIFLSYLLGSVSFAILVSRLRGLADPRSYGSGNPGATNMLRSGDKAAAALTLLGDAVKGLLAVVMVRLLFVPSASNAEEASLWLGVCAVAVFLGHLFPVFFRFQGGKGVATALGVLLGLSPLLGIVVLLVWLIVFLVTRISSLSAIAAAVSAPALATLSWVGTGSLVAPGGSEGAIPALHDPVWWAIACITILLLVRHRTNIHGLLSGKERSMRSSRAE
jgi:glycerol-3-phosphate acyltransferase PlsY